MPTVARYITGYLFNHDSPSLTDCNMLVTDTAMGINMNGLHHGDSEYVKAVYLVKDAIAVRQRTPWYWPDFIYHCLPIGRAVKEATALMHQYAYKVGLYCSFIVRPELSILVLLLLLY